MTATTIEWTDATWNPVTGCDRTSPGCDHCYALTLAGLHRSQTRDIAGGHLARIRRETEAAILAIQPKPAPRALIDAGPTWKLIGELLAAGVTKKRIGQAVTGNPATLSLQLRRERITAIAAERVAVLYQATIGPVIAPYRCTCGIELRSLDEWRDHNDSLYPDFSGHRLEVAGQKAAS